MEERKDFKANKIELRGEVISLANINGYPKYGVMTIRVYKYRFSPLDVKLVYYKGLFNTHEALVGKWIKAEAMFDDVLPTQVFPLLTSYETIKEEKPMATVEEAREFYD